MRKALGVVLLGLFACARDGGAGLFGDASEPEDDAAAPDAAVVESTQGADAAPPVDAGEDVGDDLLLDAGPRALGEPCSSDAQCDGVPCSVVHNGAHAMALCTHACGPFQPCSDDTTCYEDGTRRVCVKGCTDAAPTCLPGFACLPTFPPIMGCLPAQ